MTLPGRWSALHHGIDPGSIPGLLPWLRLLWWLARPLARLRVPPTLVTAAGAVLAADAVLLASRVPLAAAACVALAALCDGLDGAVALLGGRVSRGGAIADAVADRVSDVLFALVLWRCGVAWWAAAVVALLAVGVDGLRRIRRLPAVVTVAERPTWAICAALAALSAAVTDRAWPVWTCAAVATALGLVAAGQLAVRPGPAGPSS